MARPQNGVNGNIPQQTLGFVPQGFNINAQVQRNNQNVYAYDVSQILPTQYVPQAYPVQMNHNSMRSGSPMVNTAPYTIYPFPQQFNQYQFAPNFMQPSQYQTYPQETVTTLPATIIPTNRKSSPLAVVDPTNNRHLDLSTFNNQMSARKKTKGLIDLSNTTATEKTNNKIKDYVPKEDKTLGNIIEEIKEIDVSNEIKFNDNIATEGKESITEENNKELQHNTITPQTVSDEKINRATENFKINIDEDVSQMEKTNEDMGKESLAEDTYKIESSIESENIEDELSETDNRNDEDVLLSVAEKDSPNYFLAIDKKESDATTLRRKLIYDREYLITIKSNLLSQKKPFNLPCNFSEDIIYNESQNISCKRPETHNSVFTNNIKKQNQKFGNSNFSKYPKQVHHKLINLNHNATPVILERLKSSYLPPQLRCKDKEVDPYNELKRNIKCNLNKITPQNFQECLSEISKLNIKEKEEMSCLINEIFIKAVQEEAYSVTYAQFCNRLALIYTENQTFKGQLLKKCQDMFQTPIQDQLDNVRKEWVLKIDNEVDIKLKSLYQSDLEEQVKKAKDKYFGNIRFIGELFLHQLLAGKVIMNCIIELLKGKNDSDALLALCKLMETCGKQIDARHKDSMNNFFRTMEELSKSNELETRIRFKLKDVIDMRKRNWVLRHIQQEKKINPKTLEEQKEEAIAEAASAALATSKLMQAQAANKRNNRNVQHNAVRRQISAPPKPIAFKGLTFTNHIVDNKTVLGPSRSNWGAGSSSKPRMAEDEEWIPSQHKGISVSRSRDHSPQIKIMNKYGTLESSEDTSGVDSRPNSPPIRVPPTITKAYRIKREVVVPTMTDEERASIIFNDLLLSGDFDIVSWAKLDDVQRIIEKWIDDMMEKDASCRRSVGESFSKLLNDKLITQELLVQSFRTFTLCVDDLICDIPKLWDFMSQFLEGFISDKNSNISFFQDIFESLLPNKDVALCISMTLHAASSRLGHNIVGQVFRRSSLNWEHLVPPGDCKKFVQDNDLEFTTTGVTQLCRSGGDSLLSISEELKSMLANDDMSNEVIFHYLEKHIDKPTWKSCECSNTITTCVLKALKSKPKTNYRQYLNDKFEIIKLFSQGKIENEIEVLKSILFMADQFDNDTMTKIYDVVMTRKILSDRAFTLYLEDVSLKSQSNFEVTLQIISDLNRPSEHR